MKEAALAWVPEAMRFRVIAASEPDDEASVEHEPEGVSVITRVRVPSKSPLNMNWRLFRDKDQLKIFDVSVQGISKLSATRSEYKSVLETQGFNYLLAQICSKLEGPHPKSC